MNKVKLTCKQCKQNFEKETSLVYAYVLNEDNFIYDDCTFQNIKNALSNLDINLYNDKGEVKSIQEIFNELSIRFKSE